MKNKGLSWAVAALALFCVTAPVAASVWTNINWMLVWHLKATERPYGTSAIAYAASDTPYVRKIGNRFDYVIADKVDHKWKKYFTQAGGSCANTKVVFYDNVTNVSMNSNRMKYLYFMNQADSAGYSHEKFFLHSRKDWLSSYALTPWGGTTTADTRLGSPYDIDDGIAILQAGTSMQDYNPSYNLWRRVISDQSDSSAANAYTVLNAATDTLVMGYFEKFDALYFRVVTPPAAGHKCKVMYLASDSTLKVLTMIDSTLSSTPKQPAYAMNRFQQSGWWQFTPPADWGYKAAWRGSRNNATMDGDSKPPPLRGYWLAVICSTTASSNVKLNYVMKRPIFNRNYTTCLVPGWNDSLDSNGDDYLDSTEVLRVDSCKAAGDTCTARFKYYSRIPDFGAWNGAHPARCFINLADTTVRRTNALFIAANCDSFDGVYEDNCVPSDGSVSLSAGTPSMNLADSAFIGAGNSTGSNFPVVNARVGKRFCLIKEYRDAPSGNYGTIGVGDSTRWRPGRMYQIDHLKQDSLIYLYVVQRRNKLYIGNGSQFMTDWMRDGAQTPNGGAGDASNNVVTITSQAGPIFRGANATALTDSAPYFAWRYHNGWEHEQWNSTKNETWQSTGFPVYNVPDQWRGTGSKGTPGFYGAHGAAPTYEFHPYSASVDNGTTTDYSSYNHSTSVTRSRDMMTAIASYLCFAKKDSSNGSKEYFGIRSGTDRTGQSPFDPESSAWAPFAVKMADLGVPVADSAVVYKKACITGCAGSQDSITVFVRQYTGGIVFLRPKANSSSVYDSAATAAAVTAQDTVLTTFRQPASTGMQKLLWDGTLMPFNSTVDTLKNASGHVFIYYATGDTTRPSVSIASPSGGATLCDNVTGDGITWVTFTATDAGGITYAEFTYSVDGGSTWLNTQTQEDAYIQATSGAPTTYGVFINPANMPGVPSSQFRIRIRAFDPSGNVGSASSASNITVQYCVSSHPRLRRKPPFMMR